MMQFSSAKQFRYDSLRMKYPTRVKRRVISSATTGSQHPRALFLIEFTLMIEYSANICELYMFHSNEMRNNREYILLNQLLIIHVAIHYG